MNMQQYTLLSEPRYPRLEDLQDMQQYTHNVGAGFKPAQFAVMGAKHFNIALLGRFETCPYENNLDFKQTTIPNNRRFIMRNKLNKIALTASLVLALALTLSCSSDDNNNNGGDPNNGGLSSPSGGGVSSSSGGNNNSGGYTGSYGSLSHQGKTYKTVVIGTQTWTAENMNYDVGVSKCYDNSPANCDKYGRLYDWATAMTVCPSGWHLPSNADWDKLFRYADGTSGTESPYGSQTAGKYLKATSGWNDSQGKSGNGEDKFGFSALPCGTGNSGGSFRNVGSTGYWWSSSEGTSDYAYYYRLRSDIEGTGSGDDDKSYLYSVRCVKD
jgi:uncharacterized protein (TIGR02145 family)